MTRGKIARLVTRSGSDWGLIRPDGDFREIFFNVESLVRPADFSVLRKELEVEFEEQGDPVNGTRAVQVSITVPARSAFYF